MKYLQVICAILVYFIVFFLFGLVLEKDYKRNGIDILLKGFFVYYTFFSLVLVPMKWMKLPLTSLTIIWCCIIGLVCTISMVRNWKYVSMILRKQVDKRFLVFVLIVIGIQVMLIVPNAINTAISDSYLYIGNITTSIYTDTIEQFSPFTGLQYDFLPADRFFYCWDMHSAVLCKIFSMHPLTEANCVRTFVVIVLACLIQVRIFSRFFESKKIILVSLIVWVLITFFSLGNSNASEYFYFRTYESKCLMAVVILPMLFNLFVALMQWKNSDGVWNDLFFLSTGAYVLSASAIFVYPVALLAYGIVLLVYTKNVKFIGKIVFVMLPGIAITIMYLLYDLRIWLIPIG